MTVSEILKRENNNIDLVRLFAALLVAWVHSAALFGSEILGPPIPVHMGAGGLGVAIFFFLSGLLVANSLLSRKKPVAFVWARFMRIYPAFFVMLLVAVFVIGPAFTTLSTGEYFGSKETWQFFGRMVRLRIEYCLPGLWENRLSESVNGSAWTIPLEVGCYIGLLFAFALCHYLKMKPWIPIALAMVLSVIPHEWYLELVGKNYSILDHGYLFCFTTGATMALYKDKIQINKTLIAILLIMCVLAWRCQHVINVLFPLTVSITLLYATSLKPLVRFRPKHDISYGLYIWHWPIYQIMFTYLSGVNTYLFFVLCMVVTLPVAYLSARLVEEPCLELGRRLGKRETKWSDNGLWLIVLLFVACMVAKFLF